MLDDKSEATRYFEALDEGYTKIPLPSARVVGPSGLVYLIRKHPIIAQYLLGVLIYFVGVVIYLFIKACW